MTVDEEQFLREENENENELSLGLKRLFWEGEDEYACVYEEDDLGLKRLFEIYNV